MSLFFYGVCILGAVLGGLVLLVLYSLLVMAQRGDESREQLASIPGEPCAAQSTLDHNLRIPTLLSRQPFSHSRKNSLVPVPSTCPEPARFGSPDRCSALRPQLFSTKLPHSKP